MNFIIWGLGYQYVGSKRPPFRLALIIADILIIIASFSVGMVAGLLGASTGISDSVAFLTGWPSIITSLAFAWDAYQDALGRK